MATLAVDAPGPVEAAWLRRIAALPAWSVPSDAHVIVVSPHPDDETLGAGGTLQLLRDHGARIDLVAVTDGEASHPDVADLASRRRRELRTALDHLDVADITQVHHLAIPDGEVCEHEQTIAQTVADLAHPGSLVIGAYRDDGHPDHDATGRAVAAGARGTDLSVWSFPIWAWHWHEPATTSLLDSAERVALPPEVLARKQRAAACYRSQLTDDLGPPIVPPHVQARLLRTSEVLVRACE